MTEKIIPNKNSYSPWPSEVPAFRTKFVLQVEAVLDGVPGAFDQPEDLMRWINQNPYVRCVRLDYDAPENAGLPKPAE